MEYYSLVVLQKTLESFAREFLKESYGLDLEIPVSINGRLKSTYGRFIYDGATKNPLRIEIGKNYIDYQEWERVVGVLKHELIHYALFMQNLPFEDGHPVFEAELKKHDSPSTGNIKYRGKVVVYVCSGCGHEFKRKRRYSKNSTYVSGCCNKPIEFKGERFV